jgi:hypothetical protein
VGRIRDDHAFEHRYVRREWILMAIPAAVDVQVADHKPPFRPIEPIEYLQQVENQLGLRGALAHQILLGRMLVVVMHKRLFIINRRRGW